MKFYMVRLSAEELKTINDLAHLALPRMTQAEQLYYITLLERLAADLDAKIAAPTSTIGANGEAD